MIRLHVFFFCHPAIELNIFFGSVVSQVFFQRERKVADELVDVLPRLRISGKQEGVELNREISAVVHEGSPHFSAFPPAVVSRIDPEYEHKRNYKTRDLVKNCK